MVRFRPFACVPYARLTIGAFFVVGMAACAGPGPGPDPVAEGAGTYTLVRGNGQATPVATGLTEGNCERFIDSGTIVLDAAGSYTFTLPMHAVCHAPAPNIVASPPLESGTWSISGSALTLARSGGSVLNESNTTLANGSITTTVRYEWAGQLAPVTLVLQKQ